MSSGHGINTRQGRCYPFWTEVARCREEPDSTPEKCKNYVEDFMECLFHKKEVIFVVFLHSIFLKNVFFVVLLEGEIDKNDRIT